MLTCDFGKFDDLSEFYFLADVSKKLIFLCGNGVQYVMYDLKSDQKLRSSIQCYFLWSNLEEKPELPPNFGIKKLPM